MEKAEIVLSSDSEDDLEESAAAKSTVVTKTTTKDKESMPEVKGSGCQQDEIIEVCQELATKLGAQILGTEADPYSYCVTAYKNNGLLLAMMPSVDSNGKVYESGHTVKATWGAFETFKYVMAFAVIPTFGYDVKNKQIVPKRRDVVLKGASSFFRDTFTEKSLIVWIWNEKHGLVFYVSVDDST